VSSVLAWRKKKKVTSESVCVRVRECERVCVKLKNTKSKGKYEDHINKVETKLEISTIPFSISTNSLILLGKDQLSLGLLERISGIDFFCKERADSCIQDFSRMVSLQPFFRQCIPACALKLH